MADLFAQHWKTRWDLIATDPEEEELREDLERCAGRGNCHGCLSWCALCGDVSNVCHIFEWPDYCDQHERYPESGPGGNPCQLVFFE